MSKNKQAGRNAEAKETEEKVIPTTGTDTGTETSSESTEGGEDETPKEYKAPIRPKWLLDGDTILVDAKASPKGEPDGVTYKAELLTESGAKAVAANNIALVQALLNNQVKAHNLAGYARKHGEGTYAFDWAKKPGERGAKAAKEAAEKAAQLEADKQAFFGLFAGTGLDDETIETKWQAYLEARKI